MQSASIAQLVLHAFSPQMKGVHSIIPLSLQVPDPSQVLALVCVPAAQLDARQTVPAMYFRHAPAPLQNPSSPQLAAPPSVHSLSMSTPLATKPQTPSAPVPFFAAEHAEQRPAHAVLQ